MSEEVVSCHHGCGCGKPATPGKKLCWGCWASNRDNRPCINQRPVPDAEELAAANSPKDVDPLDIGETDLDPIQARHPAGKGWKGPWATLLKKERNLERYERGDI